MCQEVILYQVPKVDARIYMLTKLSRLSSSVYLISFAEVVLGRPFLASRLGIRHVGIVGLERKLTSSMQVG